MNRFMRGLDRPLIKVCGITNLRDAMASVDAGANALGFNFYPPSSRYLQPAAAEMIISRLPGGVLSFAVVVQGHGSGRNGNMDQAGGISRLKDFYGVPDTIDIIQLHGIPDSSQVPASDSPLLIAVSPETAPGFDEYDIIIDTSWGEGKLADWEKTSKLERPYILSGGLNPGNIEEALEKLSPAGVDVCSGVEAARGQKDHRKLGIFLRKVVDYYEINPGVNRR